MMWTPYRVLLRVDAPMHLGLAKIGNVQRTRPYVIGRAVWGALTMRLTRDQQNGAQAAVDPILYQTMGERVQSQLAFTYFFPAVKEGDAFQKQWAWENPMAFAARFMGSYMSTALSYPQQAAEEASLHEVECLLPYTRGTGQPVYLVGYIFQHMDYDSVRFNWQSALKRWQLGGERSYGWGRVELVAVNTVSADENGEFLLFEDAGLRIALQSDRPLVTLAPDTSLPAHLLFHPELPVYGRIEPLVGRVWDGHDGRKVAYDGIYYTPGSKISEPVTLEIGKSGIWQAQSHA